MTPLGNTKTWKLKQLDPGPSVASYNMIQYKIGRDFLGEALTLSRLT